MKLGKIIRKKRMDRGISQSRLAREAGISNNHMNLIELQKVDNVGMQTLESIAKVLELNVRDLLAEGAQGKDIFTPTDRESVATPAPSIFHLPILGTSGLGTGRSGMHYDIDGYPVHGENRRHHQLNIETEKNCYAVTVGDASMHPIGKGWRLAVNPELKIRPGDPVVVYLSASEEFLFREYQENAGMRLLKPYHATFDPLVLPNLGRVIMHRVFAFFPPVSLDDPK